VAIGRSGAGHVAGVVGSPSGTKPSAVDQPVQSPIPFAGLFSRFGFRKWGSPISIIKFSNSGMGIQGLRGTEAGTEGAHQPPGSWGFEGPSDSRILDCMLMGG
jgi:hypothetical protein